jgi:hypothetical protein
MQTLVYGNTTFGKCCGFERGVRESGEWAHRGLGMWVAQAHLAEFPANTDGENAQHTHTHTHTHTYTTKNRTLPTLLRT